MKRLMMAAVVCVLAGCSNDQGELRAWMQEVRANARPIQTRVEEPKRFAPFRYDDEAQVDPFSPQKLAAMVEGSQRAGANGLKPDLNRRREALEAFPLDTIRMVGHLANGQRNHALLQVDRTVYQAHVGSYAGQNFGVITRISENEVLLRELVQDAAGDWVQRDSTLRLQEGSSQ